MKYMKRMVFVSLLGVILSLVSACGAPAPTPEQSFQAKVMEIGDDWANVAPLEDEKIRKSADQITFGTKELEDIGAEAGDLVRVTYTGDVAESYPAQIQALGWTLIEKGTAVSEEESQIMERNSEVIREYLAVLPENSEELSEETCYVSVHGQEQSGRKYLDDFLEKTEYGEPAELVTVQFTVEGDPILDYLNFDGTDYYLMHDSSRDAFIGDGEKYQEYTYSHLSIIHQTEENGDLSMYLLLSDQEGVTMEDLMMYLAKSSINIEKPEIYTVVCSVEGNQ